MNGARRSAISLLLLLIPFGVICAPDLSQRLDALAVEANGETPAAVRLAQLSDIDDEARACVREQRQQLERLNESMALLDTESLEAQSPTGQLLERRGELRQRLAECELALLRTESMAAQWRQSDRSRFLDRLLAGSGDFSAPLPRQWLAALALLLIGLILGLVLRALVARRKTSRLQRAIAHALPWMTPAALLAIGMPSAAAMLPLLLILSATFAARGWLKAAKDIDRDNSQETPTAPPHGDPSGDEGEYTGFVAPAPVEVAPAPPSPAWLSPVLIALGLTLAGRELINLLGNVIPVLLPFRTALGGVSAALGLGLAIGLWRTRVSRTSLAVSSLMAAALSAATVVDLFGRPALADYLTRGSIATLVGVGAWLAMNEALGRWLADSRLGRSVVLLLLVRFLALVVLLAWLIWAWNMAALGIGLDAQLLTNGVAIGNIHIHPLRLTLGAITALALLVLVRWLQRLTNRDLSSQRGVDPAASNTVVTIIGYIGVVVALLLAISVAGFDLTNLVIIAGALSLGIGFGLQTIVSNFVSGIILLFERPIRNGDWVNVGNLEGLVSRIRVRATEIRSFDGADIIMPNSDLLAANLTNWTLNDPAGRLIIPVGIAYGSDTRKAESLLLQAAKEQALTIDDGSFPQPHVLFRAFGDNALTFELRFYISDVRSRLSTISATNFRIDELFRENGIEIAFPQRDIHVRSLPAEVASLAKTPAQDPGTEINRDA